MPYLWFLWWICKAAWFHSPFRTSISLHTLLLLGLLGIFAIKEYWKRGMGWLGPPNIRSAFSWKIMMRSLLFVRMQPFLIGMVWVLMVLQYFIRERLASGWISWWCGSKNLNHLRFSKNTFINRTFKSIIFINLLKA